MSSREAPQAWTPPDFDGRGAAHGRAPVARVTQAPVVAHAPVATLASPRPVAAPRRDAVASGWQPPALEDRRTVARPGRDEREQAYAQGFADGCETGAGEAHAAIAPALAALGSTIMRLEAAAAEFARERERNLTALALVVARKLVLGELEARPEVLQSLVARALEMLPPSVPAEVRLNPADLEALVPGIEQLAVEGRSPGVQWIGDPSLERGGFMIDSPLRIVDGRVDSALRQVYERFDA